MSAGSLSVPLASPEAERWLRIPLRPDLRVVVAGVAGGVGTTTVAALIARALVPHREVSLADHSGGTLALRADVGTLLGDGSAGSGHGLVVQDLGPHALTPGGNALDDPAQVVVVVCGPHAEGLTDALAAVHALGAHTGEPDPSGRVVVVPGGAGRGLRGADLRRRAVELGLRAAVVPVPRSGALAVGGPVPGPEAGADASEAHRVAVALAVEVVRRARWVAAGGHAPAG